MFHRRLLLSTLSALLLLAGLAGVSSQIQRALAVPQATIPGEKLVLAFYYMWYGPSSFDPAQMLDRPLAPYISDKPDVIDRQVSEAKAAGIDAFISAWAGAGSETDRNFARLLDTAKAHGLRATIYFETNSVMQQGDVASQLKDVLARYSNHPAFLRWNGKPVVFFWSPQSLGSPGAWAAVRKQVDPGNSQIWSVDTVDGSYLDVFDTVHLYSGGKWQGDTNVAQVDAGWRARIDAYNKAHSTARLWTAGVIPGWDESRVQPLRPSPKVFPRRDGDMYEENWKAAIASNPEWITITSYNEWFEGTQIEPARSYGTRYLDLTRRYASLWKNGPNPCDGGTLYPQTGHSICKQMEPYWQRYGGIPQFGFPISDPLTEQSPTDGKQYTVQYFERARFELHPENRGTPYEVLLGLVGKQFHPQTPAAAPINDGNHVYFKETGHNVSSLFNSYWQSHGGLFVSGYPISEELHEKSTDGKQYTVQYFERARFEYHPENKPPYDVLLGALGLQAWAQRGGR